MAASHVEIVRKTLKEYTDRGVVGSFTEEALAAGIQQIGSIPPKEERERVVAWFHPRSCLGMLVEAWNRPSGDGHYQSPTS